MVEWKIALLTLQRVQHGKTGIARFLLGGPTRQRSIGSCLLPSLSLVVLLLGLAGCSYEPKINTGAKAAVLRTPPKIMDDLINASGQLEKVIYGVKDAATAAKATNDVNDGYERLKSLVAEEVASLKREDSEDRQKLQGQFQGRMEQAQTTLHLALASQGKLPGLPVEFTRKAAEIDTNLAPMMQQVADVKDEPAPAVSADFVADSQPESSSWLMWLLCVLILAVCGGFLYRDGLWSNAIRLVNVIFAGLLAMNFYEWLAKYLTNFSDDIHSYVAFFDFLALWALFVLFIVIFRALTESISKVRVRFLKVVDQAGGIVLSLGIGWVMVCFTVTSLHAAPWRSTPCSVPFSPRTACSSACSPRTANGWASPSINRNTAIAERSATSRRRNASSPPTSSRSSSNADNISRNTFAATPNTRSESISNSCKQKSRANDPAVGKGRRRKKLNRRHSG